MEEPLYTGLNVNWTPRSVMDGSSKVACIVRFLIISAYIFANSAPVAVAYVGGTEPPNDIYPTLNLELPKFALKIKNSDLIILGLSRCSGVFIRSDMLLTASHCIPGTVISEVPVLRYGMRREQMVTVRVKAVFLHPDTAVRFNAILSKGGVFETGWAQKCEVPDIAIIQLDQPSSHLPIAGVDHRPVLELGARLWIGGFGDQSANIDFTARSWHNLRGSAGTFKYHNKSCFVADTDHGSVLHGDSGGPAYIRYEDGTLGVIGIISGLTIFRAVIFNLDKSQNFARLDDGNTSSAPLSKWFSDVLNGRAPPFFNFD